MQPFPPLRLNEQTASPLLKLLLAQRDLEALELSPEDTWEVFKAFASIPCRGTTGGVSFQATWRVEDVKDSSKIPFLYCTLMREVRTDPVVAGRALMIQWAVEADSSMEEVEIAMEPPPFCEELEAPLVVCLSHGGHRASRWSRSRPGRKEVVPVGPRIRLH